VVFCLDSARAQCPEIPPEETVYIDTGCGYNDACPNEMLTLRLEDIPGSCFPPGYCGPGYQIQPCDTVTWTFGDGMTSEHVGSDETTHRYDVPGNYVVSATITNSLGSVTVSEFLVAADAPSRVSFVMPGAAGAPYPCSSCVRVREGDGSIDVEIVTTLDTSRTVSVRAYVSRLRENDPQIEETFTFAPGETSKTFTVPIANDDLYYGPRWQGFGFSSATGGLLTRSPGSSEPTLVTIEDDPQPVLTIGSGSAIKEGDSGRTPFSVPVHLTAPLAVDMYADVFYIHGTAIENDFVRGGSLRIPAGQSSGTVTGWIVGDKTVEPDETFIVRLFDSHTNNGPAFGVTDATVMIVNDDVVAPATVGIPTFDLNAIAVLAVALALVAVRMIRG